MQNEILENLKLIEKSHLLINKNYNQILAELLQLPVTNIKQNTLNFLSEQKKEDNILFANSTRKSDLNDFNSQRFQLLLLLLSTHALYKGSFGDIEDVKARLEHETRLLNQRSDLHNQRMESMSELERVIAADSPILDQKLTEMINNYGSLDDLQSIVDQKQARFEELQTQVKHQELLEFLKKLSLIEPQPSKVLNGKDFFNLVVQDNVNLDSIQLYHEGLFDFTALIKLLSRTVQNIHLPDVSEESL